MTACGSPGAPHSPTRDVWRAAKLAGMSDALEPDYFSGAQYEPETVRFFDIAHEGAQARNVANQADTLGQRLFGAQVRSVVICPTDQIARAASHCAVTLAGASVPVRQPVMVAQSLPEFVGPLDVVIVVGEAAESPWASRALADASRRGAETILIAAPRGPLIDDAPDDTVVIPALPTTQGPSPVRYITGILAVLWSLSIDSEMVRRRCEDLAEAVDEEIVLDSPEHGIETNPGRALREFVGNTGVWHTGGVGVVGAQPGAQPGAGGPGGGGGSTAAACNQAVARLAAQLWSACGMGGADIDAQELAMVLERARQHRAAAHASARPAHGADPSGTAGDDTDYLFFDPFLDAVPAPEHGVVWKTVVWGQEEANLPQAFAVHCGDHEPRPELGHLAQALQLITRAYAATAYDLQRYV